MVCQGEQCPSWVFDLENWGDIVQEHSRDLSLLLKRCQNERSAHVFGIHVPSFWCSYCQTQIMVNYSCTSRVMDLKRFLTLCTSSSSSSYPTFLLFVFGGWAITMVDCFILAIRAAYDPLSAMCATELFKVLLTLLKASSNRVRPCSMICSE